MGSKIKKEPMVLLDLNLSVFAVLFVLFLISQILGILRFFKFVELSLYRSRRSHFGVLNFTMLV